MDILRRLRWVLYPSVFILVFFIGSYCSFPSSVLRTIAETSLTQGALSIAPPSRGFPKVSIKDISLWRLSGMDMDNVRIQWPGTKKEPPMSFNIDRFKGRIGIMALLSGGKSLGTDIKLYDGTMTTHSKINKQQSLTQLDINAAKVNLGKIDFIQSLLGAPLQGILDLTVDLNAQTQLSKDGAGIINLSINNTIFGPGNMNLPAGSMVPSLTVPQVSLGVITANFTLDKGLLESKTFTLSGGDFEAELQLTVTLGRIPPLSRLNGKGWFSLKKEFINSNETIKMLFDLIPELRAAKNTNGKVGFSLGGTLGRPMPKLENTPPGPAAQKKPSGPPAA